MEAQIAEMSVDPRFMGLSITQRGSGEAGQPRATRVHQRPAPGWVQGGQECSGHQRKPKSQGAIFHRIGKRHRRHLPADRILCPVWLRTLKDVGLRFLFAGSRKPQGSKARHAPVLVPGRFGSMGIYELAGSNGSLD